MNLWIGKDKSGLKDKEIIKEVESLLEMYDIVFLMGNEDEPDMAVLIQGSEAVRKTEKKLAFLTVMPFDISCDRHLVKVITKDEMDLLLDLYRTYEPSDRLIYLKTSNVYGSIWNYVDSGILSRDEAIAAFVL
ncbi:MAG: hypothetical protein K6F34_09660 [Lachnospiraceae bacterium]|nr:hypothetical protein [Lachnospiraceae bacterium]